jgi:L-rhamnose isomerase
MDASALRTTQRRCEQCQYGIGAINPNLFKDQIYKYGSLCNRDEDVRGAAVKHLLDSAELSKQTGSQVVFIWLADGSNYPGQANIRWRKHALVETLRLLHEALNPDQLMLLELYAKAALVDCEKLAKHQEANEQIDAEECLRSAFFADIRPAILEWRGKHKLPMDPLAAFRESGYESRVAKERKARRAELGIVGSGSYA